MTLAKTNETFIVQASLTIITYDHKNMYIVQATDYKPVKQVFNGTVIFPPLVFPAAFIQEKSDLKLHLHGQFYVQCCSSSLRSFFDLIKATENAPDHDFELGCILKKQGTHMTPKSQV
jgi:hypothetical protein